MGQPAIGMVQASGMRSVIEDDERRNVKFMKAQMHVGFDVLAPFCAGVINMKRKRNPSPFSSPPATSRSFGAERMVGALGIVMTVNSDRTVSLSRKRLVRHSRINHDHSWIVVRGVHTS